MVQILLKHVKIAALLVAAWMLAFVAFETVGRLFIHLVYDEALPIPPLNDLISGRDVHTVETYVGAASSAFFRWSRLALYGAVIALAASFVLHLLIRLDRWGDLGLAAGSVLVVLLLCEGAFRIAGVSGYHLPRRQEVDHAVLPDSQRIEGVDIQFRPDSDFRFCYESNPTGYFDADHCINYHVNNFGFRDDDFAIPKPPGTLRIALLGDSFAFGEGVWVEDSFSRLIEGDLSDAGANVEVLNFAVGGWGTRDQISYLRAQGLAFSPDLVLVAYVLNDADYAGGLDVWEGFRQQYEGGLLRFSSVLSFAYASLAQSLFVEDYVDEMIAQSLDEGSKWAASFEELRRGRDLAEAAGARFAVAILPFMYDLNEDHAFLPIHQMIADFCRSQGIPVRDVLPAFFGRRHTDLWVHPSDPHPNREGHRLIAEALEEFVVDEGLLDFEAMTSWSR
jgi:lysophospholipase L1-like esterase